MVPGPPLFSDQKNFIETVPPHLFQGLDDRPLPSPPLSEGLGPATEKPCQETSTRRERSANLKC